MGLRGSRFWWKLRFHMLARGIFRLFVTCLFTLVGTVMGCLLGKPDDSGIILGAVAGSLLGSLLGCFFTIPLTGIPLRRQLLSFLLAPGLAFLVMVAVFSCVGDPAPRYERVLLPLVFFLLIPVSSLFGFYLPILLAAQRR